MNSYIHACFQRFRSAMHEMEPYLAALALAY